MDRIQTQASELWDIIFADETADTYQNALNLTGTIVKEAAQLVWLVICSFFVFGAWFGDTSVRAGKSIRTWVDQQSDTSSAPTAKTPIAEKGKSLLDTGRTGIAYLLNQARAQLGIDPAEVPTIAPSPSTPPQPAPPLPAKQPIVTEGIAPEDGNSDDTASNRDDDIKSAAASVPTTATSYGTGYGSSARTADTADDGWPPQEDD